MFKIIAAIYFNRSANEFLRDELFTFTQFFPLFLQFYIKSNTYSLFSNRNVMAEVGLCPRNFSKEINSSSLISKMPENFWRAVCWFEYSCVSRNGLLYRREFAHQT